MHVEKLPLTMLVMMTVMMATMLLVISATRSWRLKINSDRYKGSFASLLTQSTFPVVKALDDSCPDVKKTSISTWNK